MEYSPRPNFYWIKRGGVNKALQVIVALVFLGYFITCSISLNQSASQSLQKCFLAWSLFDFF